MAMTHPSLSTPVYAIARQDAACTCAKYTRAHSVYGAQWQCPTLRFLPLCAQAECETLQTLQDQSGEELTARMAQLSASAAEIEQVCLGASICGGVAATAFGDGGDRSGRL